MYIGQELLCDRCAGRKTAEITGLPELPDPPPDESRTGPDGRAHRFRYRLWRAPTGIVAEAEEADRAPGDGYHFKVMGPHDAIVDRLLEALRVHMLRGLGRLHLEPHPRSEGWLVAGDTVTGRLEWSEAGLPYDVVVDGRRLSWEEFGRAMEPFEGWEFTLRIEDTPVLDVGSTGETAAEVIPWPGREAPSQVGSAPNDDEEEPLEPEDEEEFLAAWDRAEASAVALLRRALAELLGTDPPPGALQAASGELRSGMRTRSWPYEHIWRAAGWKPAKLPRDDVELWLGAVGGLISPREETGLDPEEEASIMALEHADWLGAVVGLVRAGVGASADPQALVQYINDCPEVEGAVDPDEESLVETAFELVLPAWEAAGAVDDRRRLTPLGRWGLPRALAWAWNGDFDRPAED